MQEAIGTNTTLAAALIEMPSERDTDFYMFEVKGPLLVISKLD